MLSVWYGLQVEGPFSHMLPEVNPLPDVRDSRFNIDSLYGLLTKGPACASGSNLCSDLRIGPAWENLRFNINGHAQDFPRHNLC